MSTPHLSRQLLDEILVGGRDPDHGDIRAHLDSCEGCRDRLAAFAKEDADFLAGHPPDPFVKALLAPREPWWRSLFHLHAWRWSAATTAAAICVGLGIWFVSPQDIDSWRPRSGGSSLQLYRVVDQHLEPLHATTVQAGTRLRVAVTVPGATHGCAYFAEVGRPLEVLTQGGEAFRLSPKQRFVPGMYEVTPSVKSEYLLLGLGEIETDCDAAGLALKTAWLGNQNLEDAQALGFATLIVEPLPRLAR